MTRKNNLNNRGQITIFIILALILVVSIALLFILFRTGSIEPNIKDASNPQQYIELCVKDAVNEAVDILSMQGGYIEPTNYKLYQDEKIAYLCYNRNDYGFCVNQEPMLINHLQEEITDYIAPISENCFQSLKNDLEKKGDNVNLGSMQINTRLMNKQILVEINREVKITGKDSMDFNKIEVSVANPLYNFAFVANEIINQETLFNYFDYVSYCMVHSWILIERPLIPSTDYAKDNTKIYILTDKNTGKKFVFAVKGFTTPPGWKPRQ